MGTGNQNQCLSGSAGRCVPVSDRHIVGLVVQIENQAGHYQLLLGTIPSRMATYIGKLGFLMICAFGATFLALGTFAALYRDAPASLYLKQGFYC